MSEACFRPVLVRSPPVSPWIHETCPCVPKQVDKGKVLKHIQKMHFLTAKLTKPITNVGFLIIYIKINEYSAILETMRSLLLSLDLVCLQPGWFFWPFYLLTNLYILNKSPTMLKKTYRWRKRSFTGGLKRLQAKMFVPVEVSIDSTTILSTYYLMTNFKIFSRALFEIW